MAIVNYYLKDKTIETKTKVILFFSHGGKRIKVPTQYSIAPKYWDFAKQRIKPTYSSSTEKNINLNSWAEKAIKLFDLKLNDDKMLSRADLVNMLVPVAEVMESRVGLVSGYKQYIEINKHQRKLGSIKNYNTTFGHLSKFTKGNDLGLADVNTQFYEEFLEYLMTQKKLENNTVGANIKNLKAFMQWAFDRGYHENLTYKKFKVLKEKKPVIFLTKDEFEKIDQLDLSEKTRLEKVRDLFILQCATGLRFSDLSSLREENLKSDHFLVTTIKVTKTIMIPYNSYSKKIIEKYPDGLPIISEQKYNKFLKDLCEEAKIDESVYFYRIVGSKRENLYKPKYQFISSHTARRTFITQSLERGIPPEVIMEYTGHSDIGTLMRYVGITDRLKFDQMKKWG